MKLKEEKKEGVALFTIEGRLDSNTSSDVEKEVLKAITEGYKNIVLDFSLLDYLSSAGIRILVHCHKELEKQGGRIALAGVPKPIENILYITGFLPYFEIFDTRSHAFESLQRH